MVNSIIQENERECYLCGATEGSRYQAMHWHHIFGGPNRNLSEKYGLKVRLCGYSCHEYGPNAVHQNHDVDIQLKQIGQRAFEEKHGTREDFMRIFGKNWL